VASWRPSAGRKPCLDEAPTFFPDEEVDLFLTAILLHLGLVVFSRFAKILFLSIVQVMGVSCDDDDVH
jgi:hypothetical protein